MGLAQPAAAPPPPPVLAEREVLRERAEALVPVPEPALTEAPIPIAEASITLETAARIERESAGLTAKGKAAFTLRLDGDRHLRLRLASAIAHQSAQGLVVRALDQFLLAMPEVETLVAQLPAKGSTR